MQSPRALPFRAGPYECIHYIGGSLAEVYLARDLRTGVNRAVKVLGAAHRRDSEFMLRFAAEAEVARLCSHPNIITTFEAGQSDGLAYIAMEYMRGETLKVLLERGRLQTISERISIAWQVAKGLEYLHQQSIIHRDIKPENVSVDAFGQVQIFDFGIAKLKNQQITKEGQLLGTPLYMSPEQVRGDIAGPSTDIYSFGVLMFVMFTGSFPYRAVDREDLYAAIVFYPPDLTPLERMGIPEPIASLIVRCLNKQSSDRPPSFDEVEAVLRPLAAPAVAGTGATDLGHVQQLPIPVLTPVNAAAPGGKKSRFNWQLLLLAALVLIACAGATLWYASLPAQLPARIASKRGAMVLVPGGASHLGKDRRAVPVAGFYIDRAEVSNESYAAFCRESGRACPALSIDAPSGFPTVDVSYDDAVSYCTWAGSRLPSEMEWEKAARGPDGLPYPWGDQPRFELVNMPRGSEPHELEPAESNVSGASAYGAINMLGNVWEWVARQEPLEPADLKQFVLNPPVFIGERAFQIRGGSYQQRIELNEAVWDYAVAPARLRRSDIGFRCARPIP